MNTPPDNDGESAPTDEVLSGEVVATPDGADSVDGSPEQPAGDLAGALGGLDMGAMLQMAQDMGERVQEAQEALATTEIVGSAGGGLVTVTLNGHLHVRAVHIDPGAVDADDPTVLEDLIVAAWTDAHNGVARLQAQADPLGGVGGLGGALGGLGGLLGG